MRRRNAKRKATVAKTWRQFRAQVAVANVGVKLKAKMPVIKRPSGRRGRSR